MERRLADAHRGTVDHDPAAALARLKAALGLYSDTNTDFAVRIAEIMTASLSRPFPEIRCPHCDGVVREEVRDDS